MTERTEQERLSEAERFLTRLFGAAWGPRWLAVLAFEDVVRKKAPPDGVFWCENAKDAARIGIRESASAEIYFTCALRAPRVPGELEGERRKYGGERDTIATPGVWLDIDRRSPFRADGLPYPETEEECTELIDTLGLLPSAVVRSGYGLQAWWLFDGPQDLADPTAGKRAAMLSEAWTRKAQAVWKAAGYHLDSKFSLATILRMPGTWNRKAGAGGALPVELESMPGSRYSLGEIEEACADEVRTLFDGWSRTAGVEVGPFQIRAGAEPPAGKFGALMANVPKFRHSWLRQRSDLNDQSLSGYGMSLATIAADAAWTDQEIVDLLVAHARLYGKGPDGASYYRLTLGKAKQSARGRREKREAKDDAKEAERAETRAAISGGTGKTLETLSARLEIAVAGFVQRGRVPGHYYLKLQGGVDVGLGTAFQAMSQAHVRTAVWEATGHVVHHFEGDGWDDVLRMFSAVKTIEELPEGDRAQETRDWIAQHIEDSVNGRGLPDRASEEEDRREMFHRTVQAKAPFADSKKGCIYVNTTGLVMWLRMTNGVNVPTSEVRSRLAELGFISEEVEVNRIIGHYRRSYWNCGNDWTV